MTPFEVRLGDHEVTYVQVQEPDDLPAALAAAALPSPVPVLVLVGGAGGLDAEALRHLAPVFTEGLAPAIEECGAVAVDGGTDSGVMRLLGNARRADAATFALVGVAAQRTVRMPGGPVARDDAADLERGHTHFVLVPGDDWGAEAPWIARTASALAGNAPSVTVLVNGGDIAYADVGFSLEVGRAVVVIGSSGRASDDIAAALRGEAADPRAVELARSGLVTCVDVADPSGVRAAVTAALRRPSH